MYITKPFDLMVLRANISNILENGEIIRKKLQQASVNIESKTEDIPMPTNLDKRTHAKGYRTGKRKFRQRPYGRYPLRWNEYESYQFL